MTKLKQETRISKRLDQLKKIYANLSPNQWVLVHPMLERCAFMEVTLQDLEKKINDEGTVSMYQNGANQSGDKPSGAISSYNTTIRNYNALIKTLNELLPKETTKSKWDSFLNE